MRNFLILLCACYISVFSFSQNPNLHEYVSVNGMELQLNGEKYFPVTLNYIVEIVHDNNGNYFIAPAHQYSYPNPARTCSNPADCYQEILDDFEAIDSMGFNSLRVVGIAYGLVRPWWDSLNQNWSNVPSFITYDNQLQNEQIIPITAPYTTTFDLMEDVLDAAETFDLKVQFIIGGKKVDSSTIHPQFISFMEDCADHFKDNTTLYSYDYLNEPYHFDTDNYSKQEVCELVSDFHNAVKQHSPNHLTTIGIHGTDDVFEWDPGMMSLDFISYHFYSDTSYTADEFTDDVLSKIKWAGATAKRPWIIGETALPSSLDTAILSPYTQQEQKNFTEITLEAVVKCGGAGYSYWNYCDQPWEPGYSVTHRNDVRKLVVEAFYNFDFNNVNGTCPSPSSYYNPGGWSNYTTSGLILDQFNNPIENAFVLGVSPYPNYNPYVTYSKSNGTFELSHDENIDVIKVSAPGTTIQEILNPSSTNNNFILHDFLSTNQHLSISGVTINTNQSINYNAHNSIIASNFLINGSGTSGGSSLMKSMGSIILKSGFKCDKGGYYKGSIEPIDPDCNTITALKVEEVSRKKPNFSGYPYFGVYNNENIEMLESEYSNERIVLFPNPTNGEIKVSFNGVSGSKRITINNSVGSLVYEKEIFSNTIKLDLSHLQKGLYLVSIESTKGIEIKRLVIN